MRLVKIDSSQAVPEIGVVIAGPRSFQRVNLIFDTGAAITQIDTGLIEDIGLSAIDAIAVMNVVGATGNPQSGYIVKVDSLSLFGKQIENITVGVYDFENFPGVDGLLGWDVISQLHIELIGCQGILKVF